MPGHLCHRNVECTICTETLFGEKDAEGRVLSLAMTRCGHIYHQKCIMAWMDNLLAQKRNPQCPVCRSVIEHNRFAPAGRKWAIFEMYLDSEQVEEAGNATLDTVKTQLADEQAKSHALRQRVARLEADVADREETIGAMTRERLRLDAKEDELKAEVFALREKCTSRQKRESQLEADISQLRFQPVHEKVSSPARLLRAILPLPARWIGSKSAKQRKSDIETTTKEAINTGRTSLKRGHCKLEASSLEEPAAGGLQGGNVRNETEIDGTKLDGDSHRAIKKLRLSPARRNVVSSETKPRRVEWRRAPAGAWSTKAVGFPVDFTLSDKAADSSQVLIKASAEARPEAGGEDEVGPGVRHQGFGHEAFEAAGAVVV